MRHGHDYVRATHQNAVVTRGTSGAGGRLFGNEERRGTFDLSRIIPALARLGMR